MTKKLITIILLLQGFLLISETTFGQYQDTRVKIGDYGISQIENRGHLCKHYIDSISNHNLMYLNAGYSEIMPPAQRHLGHFKLLLDDPSVYEDSFYLVSFDSLYPKILSACEEFGFFQFVNSLNEINEHRNQKNELFQSDTTRLIFNKTDNQFDQELYDLRQKLYRLKDEYYFKDIYVETISKYILTHRAELIK